jgi:hypothetical protein
MSRPARDKARLLSGHAAADDEERLVMAGQPERSHTE